MTKLATSIAIGIPLAVLPTLSAVAQTETGINSVGPALFIFTIAGALLLMLVFRSTANHVAGYLTAELGRRRIIRALERRSPDVLHDIVLPGAYGGRVRIDHAILTAGGILCIQTKHFNGIVFGGEDEPQWTNVDGVRRQRFLNPLIQNEGRSRALRQVVPDVPVANLVIFTGSVEFTSAPPQNVIHVRKLESFVARFVFGPSKVKDWDAVWLTVKAATLADTASRENPGTQLTFS